MLHLALQTTLLHGHAGKSLTSKAVAYGGRHVSRIMNSRQRCVDGHHTTCCYPPAQGRPVVYLQLTAVVCRWILRAVS